MSTDDNSTNKINNNDDNDDRKKTNATIPNTQVVVYEARKR